jgi:hypothetical protein
MDYYGLKNPLQYLAADVYCVHIPAGSVLSAQRLRPRMWLLLFWEVALNTLVYIDGFNLYYAIRGKGYKWLNVKALAELVLAKSQYNVTGVKYYTARVSGATDPAQPGRQQVYFNALRSVPGVEIHLGKFLAKNQWRPVVTLPVANRQIDNNGAVVFVAGEYTVYPDATLPNCQREILSVGSYPLPGNGKAPAIAPHADAIKVQVHAMEEKGSDVNLACHLVNDAWAGRFDAAVVISNDTDLVEPIRIVTQELKKNVLILSTSQFGASRPLQAVATSVLHIHNSHLKAAQFPATIPGTSIVKPAGW